MFSSARFFGSMTIAVSGFILPMKASNAGVDLGNGWNPTALEMAQVPYYCQKQFQSKNDAKVVSALSPGCDGVHHLCAGLVLMTRVTNYTIPKQERQRILGRAKQEFDYMSGRPNSSCLKARMIQLRASEQRVRSLEIFIR